MEKLKICYLGNDKVVISGLRECFAQDGKYSIETFSNYNELPMRSVEYLPDVIIIDQPQGRLLITPQKIRAMAPSADFVVVFLFRESNLDAAVEALGAGYDLCWDTFGVESALFRAAINREVTKKIESSDRKNGTFMPADGGSKLLNETVAALVEGSVELLALKEDLEKHNRELELVRDELEQFVHTISHDLKEPLMALRTFTKMLSEHLGEVDGESGEYLKMIRQSVERMSKQIDGLLAFSRAGRVKADSLVEDPAAIIADIKRDRGLDRRGDVDIRIQPNLPPLKAHPEQLRQIFGNLISNGIKYNRNSHKVVEIGTASAPPEEIEQSFVNNEDAREFALLYVSDNGIGIQAEDRNAPFELFRRLDESPEFEGDGAGLTIVKRAVNSLGGEIDYISEPGKGTVMYFTLPVAVKPILAQAPKPWEGKRTAAQLRDALFNKN